MNFPFTENMDKNLSKNISKNLIQKNTVKNFLITLKSPEQMHLKLLQKRNSENGSKMSNLIGNKIEDKITKVSKSSPQNNFESETEIKERYISIEERQQIIDELRLT